MPLIAVLINMISAAREIRNTSRIATLDVMLAHDFAGLKLEVGLVPLFRRFRIRRAQNRSPMRVEVMTK